MRVKVKEFERPIVQIKLACALFTSALLVCVCVCVCVHVCVSDRECGGVRG